MACSSRLCSTLFSCAPVFGGTMARGGGGVPGSGGVDACSAWHTPTRTRTHHRHDRPGAHTPQARQARCTGAQCGPLAVVQASTEQGKPSPGHLRSNFCSGCDPHGVISQRISSVHPRCALLLLPPHARRRQHAQPPPQSRHCGIKDITHTHTHTHTRTHAHTHTHTLTHTLSHNTPLSAASHNKRRAHAAPHLCGWSRPWRQSGPQTRAAPPLQRQA
jgi:hypothetical protein